MKISKVLVTGYEAVRDMQENATSYAYRGGIYRIVKDKLLHVSVKPCATSVVPPEAESKLPLQMFIAALAQQEWGKVS